MKNVNKNQQFFINELNEQREELINTYGEDKGIKNWVDQDYYDGEYYITPVSYTHLTLPTILLV